MTEQTHETARFYQLSHPKLQGGAYTFRVAPGESAYDKANVVATAARRAYPEITTDDAIAIVFLPEMTDKEYYKIEATNDPLTMELSKSRSAQ